MRVANFGALLALIGACANPATEDAGGDSGVVDGAPIRDAGAEFGIDANVDASRDGGADTGVDDRGFDAGDAGVGDAGDARDGGCLLPAPPTMSTSVVPAALVRWAADGNADDTSGTRNGTERGAVSYVPGVNGQAFSLNGIDQSIDIPNGPIAFGARAFSVSAWIRQDTAGSLDQKIFYAGRQTVEGTFQLSLIDHRPVFAAFLQTGGGSDWNGASSCPTLPLGRWVHLTGVRRGASLEIWIDGALVTSNEVGDVDIDPAAPTSNASIGVFTRGAVQPPSYFEGDIDDVRIFGVALSAEEIAALYLADRP